MLLCARVFAAAVPVEGRRRRAFEMESFANVKEALPPDRRIAADA
jgi:hypothetical protein